MGNNWLSLNIFKLITIVPNELVPPTNRNPGACGGSTSFGMQMGFSQCCRNLWEWDGSCI